MKKILVMAVGLATILSADTCSEKNKAYSIGYVLVSDELKKPMENPVFQKRALSSGARTKCHLECSQAAIDPNSDDWSQKKYSTCYDMCIQGAQDAFNGPKPKMKLCE